MNQDLSSLIFATQARVLVRATTAELVALARGRASDPSVFDEYPPFVWGNEISSDRLDSYFTKMDPATTLPNFARAAAQGVAFLIGHDHSDMPFGSTLTGTLETAGEVTRVLADAYCLQEEATRSFVSRVRAGIVKDDSVGFYGGQWICSICGRDMLTDWWECWHVPGLMYEIKDGEAAVTTVREVLAWALVKNAELSEVSAVYDGATPGAAILARQASEAGHLSPTQAQLIEQRYRIHLPGKRITVPGTDLPALASPQRGEQPTQEIPMPPENTEERQSVDTAPPHIAPPHIAPPAASDPANPFEPIRQIFSLAADADVLAFCRELVASLPRLRLLADDGRAYREDLVADAMAEGARALGSVFAEETYRSVLEAAPLATIKRMRDDWRTIGDARLPGERLTIDGVPEPAPSAPAAPAVPDAAYRG